ncbi:MAG: rRNA maturation RNase YbeY [Gemmatimonadota bacterium]|nr:rRNA maturation RNase YbeY [Gemmatimonadota bacterium]MDE2873603.1 rRNA maturation RNase YbeY [Gemmatimonadota bacterium]
MISVHVNAPEGVRVPRRLLRRAVRRTLRREGVLRGELSVTFMDDPGVAELHGRYRGRPEVTDVLSFALHREGEDPLGDVYVGYAQALRQAADAGVDPEEELVRLAVHGALHVLGYRHPEGPERGQCEMFRVQERLLRELGLARAPEGRGR